MRPISEVFFAPFMAMWGKQMSAEAVEIQKENCGLPRIFQS